MADLRIVDAPLLSTVKGTEKIPTGGEGNFSVSVNQVADFAKLKWVLATEGYVNNAVGNVQVDLNLHKNNKSNPHQVTKTQVGLGNVDNTADLDKPVSNATQSAIITAVNPKADKTYVDDQLEFKADKQDVYTKLETYTKQESADLVSSNISVALTPINYSLDLAKRGVINTFNSTLSYNTNDRVVLSDGGFVVSTIDGNTNDPNTDMTGWFLPYMRGSQNLVELTDKATSRSNLDVYSKSEVLAKNNNLSELSDKAVARTNLDVYSKAETNTAISNATTPTATETIAGKAKIATTAIAQAGTNDTDIITAKKLRDALNASGDAPVFACRAWVNFNGTGVVSIRASGNVSSITDNSTGNYTINFTTALPDSNYAVSYSAGQLGGGQHAGRLVSLSDISVNVYQEQDSSNSYPLADSAIVTVAVFR